MLKLEFSLTGNVLRIIDGDSVYTIKASCEVRNEINGRRKPDEVIRSMPDGLPVYPRQFPRGTWNVGRPQPRHQPDREPYFIPTDAWQELPVWILKDGRYDRLSGVTVIDRDYGMHCSVYATTLGCIKIHNKNDILMLVRMITKALDAGREVILVVT